MVLAFATPLGDGTNNKAEAEAALFGLSWALELGHRNILIELDSQLVVQWISKKEPPIGMSSIKLRESNNLSCKLKILSVIIYSGKQIGLQMHYQNTVTR